MERKREALFLCGVKGRSWRKNSFPVAFAHNGFVMQVFYDFELQ